LLFFVSVVGIINNHIDFTTENQLDTNSEEVLALQKELDSMRIFHRESNQPKVYPFNPNFITDFKGYKLGMSTEEIDRLLDYRKKINGLIRKKILKRLPKFPIRC
jgi:hypothetical protein